MWSVLTTIHSYTCMPIAGYNSRITILTIRSIFLNIEHLYSLWLNTFTTIFILQLLCMLKLLNKICFKISDGKLFVKLDFFQPIYQLSPHQPILFSLNGFQLLEKTCHKNKANCETS